LEKQNYSKPISLLMLYCACIPSSHIPSKQIFTLAYETRKIELTALKEQNLLINTLLFPCRITALGPEISSHITRKQSHQPVKMSMAQSNCHPVLNLWAMTRQMLQQETPRGSARTVPNSLPCTQTSRSSACTWRMVAYE